MFPSAAFPRFRIPLLVLLAAGLAAVEAERLILDDGREVLGVYDAASQTLTLPGNGLARMALDPARIKKRIKTTLSDQAVLPPEPEIKPEGAGKAPERKKSKEADKAARGQPGKPLNGQAREK